MRIQLSEHFTYQKLLRFSLPTIAMMIFTSIYGIVDGFFVSNYVGKTAFAAVNLIMPYLMIQGCFGFMIGTGGGALVAKTLGERKRETADRYCTMLVWFTVILGVLISVVSILIMRPVVLFLGAEGAMVRECMIYGVIMSAFNAAFMLQYFFQSFFVVAEKPNLGFGITMAAGITNIVLDALFIAVFHWGVAGAAAATVIAQYVSGLGLFAYTFFYFPEFRFSLKGIRLKKAVFSEIARFSSLTCLQQSVMNLGILMVQGLVNSFGPAVMAAFAAAVKIDSFAYMPVQDFGNAFSTFTAQNFGAKKQERIQAGMKSAVWCSVIFCLIISLCVFVFARPLMLLFVKPTETEILAIGIRYLHIEGSFYFGIGCLFLLYGYYRAVERPGMSVVLTGISLGTRVLLAYVLSAVPSIGVVGIWWSVPIGWLLADLAGFGYLLWLRRHKKAPLTCHS